MHPTVTRCVQWAAGLWVLGALVLIYGSPAYLWFTELMGANAEVGLGLVNIVLTVVRSAIFPMGAVLIGAAVVIQTLTGGVRGDEYRKAKARAARAQQQRACSDCGHDWREHIAPDPCSECQYEIEHDDRHARGLACTATPPARD